MNFIRLNKLLPIPLYVQIRDSIEAAIDSGLLKDKTKLPTEDEICETFNVSRPVVRQAYSDLIARGKILRFKGKGTFVNKRYERRNFLNEMSNFTQEMQKLNMKPTTKVLQLEIITHHDVAFPLLNIAEGESCIHYKRLRYADDIPVYMEDTFISADRFPGLEKIDFETNSLYQVLEDQYHTEIVKAFNTYNAQVVSDANAILLEVEKKSAVHCVTTLSYDKSGEAVEYSLAYFPGGRNKFDVLVRNNQTSGERR